MASQVHSKSAYYNGLHSEPIFVDVAFEDFRALLVDVAGQSVAQINFHQIELVRERKSQLDVLLKSDHPKKTAPQLVVFDTDLQSEFLTLWKGFQAQQNASTFSLLKVSKSWLMLLLLAPLVLMLVWELSSHLHWLTPLSYDRYLGDKAHEQFLSKLPRCQSDSLQAFFDQGLESLRLEDDQFQYQIHIINDPMVNAMALPGGHLYFFKGLIEKSESPEEVLGVLAHEMAHVESRHSVRQLQKSIGMVFLSHLIFGSLFEGIEALEGAEIVADVVTGALFLKHSREFESDADDEGLKRLEKAQIDPLGLAQFFQRLEAEAKQDSSSALGEGVKSLESWVSTHPSHSQRVKRIQAFTNRPHRPNNRDLSFYQWGRLKKSCGEDVPFQWKSLLGWE